MSNKLKITLIKSTIGRKPKHIHIASQLGLRKMHKTVYHNDNPSIRGLVHQISYMLQVEEVTQ
jgi:large subunit ribosomal protein L30